MQPAAVDADLGSIVNTVSVRARSVNAVSRCSRNEAQTTASSAAMGEPPSKNYWDEWIEGKWRSVFDSGREARVSAPEQGQILVVYGNVFGAWRPAGPRLYACVNGKPLQGIRGPRSAR